MTLAKKIYQHCLNLPDNAAQQVLDYVEFLEQRHTQPKADNTEAERREALAYLDTVHIDWNGKPIANRNALYDDARS